MLMFSRERREREGSTANWRRMRGGGGVVNIMNVDEGEQLMKYDREEYQTQ